MHPPFPAGRLCRHALVLSLLTVLLAGCGPVYNNTLQVNTAVGKVTTGGTVLSPLGSQPVAGQWTADIPLTSTANTEGVAPFGTVYGFSGVTLPCCSSLLTELNQWPTQLVVDNARMPAYWDFQWEHPDYCVDVGAPPYPLLPNPADYTNLVEQPSESSTAASIRGFNCFTNSPDNPDFAPTEVNPQFVLDNELPSTVTVSAFSPISAAASITNLRVFSMGLANPATVSAVSIASNGLSATFPYPTGTGGTALPAGPYITTITTDPVGGTQTTNGMEPLYIAHNDTSWPSAFGLDVAVPEEVVTTVTFSEVTVAPNVQRCLPTSTTSKYGGSSLPLVTLPTLGELGVGTSANKIAVGSDPTVVIAYNGVTQSSTITLSGGCEPGMQNITYTGAQSALVVNTGSNSVSLVNIGQYPYPTGTVAVGSKPVAAVINPAGTLAYVANYARRTISEISLQNVGVTRTLAVAAHPTAVAFDSNGNLWVGGQGNL